MTDLDLAIELLDRRIAVLTKARDSLGAARLVLEATGNTEAETNALLQISSASSAKHSGTCGCGRRAIHIGRFWFRRGYSGPTERRIMPKGERERARKPRKANSLSDTSGLIPRGGDSDTYRPGGDKGRSGAGIEPVTQEEKMVTVDDLVKEVPVLIDPAQEQYKNRIQQLKEAAQRRQDENARKHQEVKDARLRVRGICPKCNGPMGRSSYAACMTCMGKASQKYEASVVSSTPNSLAR
jgi:hypothetical protein